MSKSRQLPIGAGHCPQCGESWRGMKAEHCSVCHQTFTGNEAGEKHRVGEYPNRRCTVERLFWNEKRRMWQATEPGTRSEVWETIRGKMR